MKHDVLPFSIGLERSISNGGSFFQTYLVAVLYRPINHADVHSVTRRSLHGSDNLSKMYR